MILRKTAVSMTLTFLVFFALGIFGASRNIQARFVLQSKPTSEAPEEVDDAIRTAVQNKIDQNRTMSLGFMMDEVVIDNIQYANDKTTALVWLALRDPETGEIIATEPGFSIAHNEDPSLLDNSDSWEVTLQQEGSFIEQMVALPAELLTEELRNRFLAPFEQTDPSLASAVTLTGYKLPWTAGVAKKLTNSIGHVYEVSGGLTSCPTSCRYAYDFADGTMFPILAAKGGTVKAYKTTCSNGDTSCTNYLVLEDQSTVPTSYQLYYHMAYNSVPARLRTIGTEVRQGEYVGDADDTGYSTGHHLHFHVYYSPTGANWSWGNSVDFRFDDVATNGGYPRMCTEAAQYPNLGAQCNPGNQYVSGNTPANPPTATLVSPADRQVITGRTVKVSGTANDDIQIARIQVLANYDGNWKPVVDIPPVTGAFSQDVNLCGIGIPNGPLGLTVRVYDREGSQAKNIPVRQIIWTGSCTDPNQPPPPPACTPSANQVALYAGKDYTGACTRFDVNNTSGYTTAMLGAVGDNQAASIQVGSNVRAILYDKNADVTARVNGRMETIAADDPSLEDNLIGMGTVSGLWVISRTNLLDYPLINVFGNQTNSNASPTSLDSLVFSWKGGSGVVSYDVILTGPGTNWTKNVAGRTDLSIGNLAAGSYTLTVRANAIDPNTSRTVVKNFTVTPASFPAAGTRTAPYQESFEGGSGEWVGSGLWRYGAATVGSRSATKAWIYNNGTNYNDSTWRAGDLTSPPIQIPAGATYYLRFSYFVDVEGGSPYWDQRRVQISDGGPFTDLLQLTDDKQIGQIWLNSGAINLSAYSGKTIRLRFHFDTVDEDYNNGLGWMVDDISISTLAPNTSCASTNNSPANAQTITVGSTVNAVICPERDVDYYRFNAAAGQSFLIDINAKSLNPPSALDAYLYLLDSDGRSVIAENDDEQYGVLQDPLLIFTAQRSGVYYLKIKPWDYPSAGGPSHYYQLSLRQNQTLPPQSVQLLTPAVNRLTPTNPFDIQVAAVDYDGGMVKQVDFYWHGPDWSSPQWVKLGSDTDGSNGWTYNVNPAQYGGVNGAAVYVQAISQTGGVLGSVRWDLIPDSTTPISRMAALPAQINSTVIQLQWSASDPQNDIDRYEIQYQINKGSGWGAWQNWTERPLPGNINSTWFSAYSGASYRFRMRAIDRAGNQEAYPDTAEASTTVSATCTPDAGETTGQSLESSIALPRSTNSPLYNLCKAGASPAGDEDWLSINAQSGEAMLFMLMPKGGGAAFSATLYNSNRQEIRAWSSTDYGLGATARWNVPQSGTYYLRIKPINDALFGTDVRYQVWYGPGNWLNLPIINR